MGKKCFPQKKDVVWKYPHIIKYLFGSDFPFADPDLRYIFFKFENNVENILLVTPHRWVSLTSYLNPRTGHLLAGCIYVYVASPIMQVAFCLLSYIKDVTEYR